MIIKRLKMENYKVFKNDIIEFSYQNDYEKRNTTIIRAENNAGKTTILTALLFGLFGVVDYKQFDIPGGKNLIPNRDVLHKNGYAKAEVSVEFIVEGVNYEIIRQIDANYVKGIEHQGTPRSLLQKEGIPYLEDENEISNFMSLLISENLRPFIFFDGVKFTEIFNPERIGSKREIREIIERLLNIRDLDNTINTITRYKDDISKYTAEDSELTTELQEVLATIKNNEAKREQAQEQLFKFEKQQEKLKSNLKTLELELSQNEEYSKDLEKIRLIEGKMDEIDAKLLENSKSFGEDVLSSVKYIISHEFGSEIYKTFDKLAMDNSSAITLIEKAISRNQCYCSDDELEKEEKINLEAIIKELKKDTQYSPELRSLAQRSLGIIDIAQTPELFHIDMIEKNLSKREEMDSLLNKESNEFSRKYSETQNILGDSIHEKNIRKGEITNQISSNHDLIENINNKINNLNDEIELLKTKKDNVQAKLAETSGNTRIYESYVEIEKRLKKIRSDYIKEAQENISKRANEYFINDLLSETDKQSIRNLEIDSSFNIKAFDHSGQENFSSLSAGTKQLAAMAFTLAITAEAFDAKPKSNFPMVMDSPFMNLDASNRERLIKLVPQIVEQWIITPTNTEVRREELEIFKMSNYIGRIYSIEKLGNNNSRIKPYKSIEELITHE